MPCRLRDCRQDAVIRKSETVFNIKIGWIANKTSLLYC